MADSKAITRAEITDSLVQEVGLPKQDCSALLERVLELIASDLVEGRNVKLSRFGNFTVSDKSARMGRNPKTRKAAMISARRVVSFHPSPILRDRVDGALKK